VLKLRKFAQIPLASEQIIPILQRLHGRHRQLARACEPTVLDDIPARP
jgi:hypothetical protein